jgi:hypothetical protein
MSPRKTAFARLPRCVKGACWPILAGIVCGLALAGPVVADALLPAEGQLSYRTHVQFEWLPVRAAERYRLQVVEDDGSRDPFAGTAPAVDLDLDALRPRVVVTQGLQFGVAYAWRVRGVGGTPDRWSPTHRFATASLPEALPTIWATSSGAGPIEPGLTLVEIFNRNAFDGTLAVAVDAAGEVVWFREFPQRMGDIRMLPNGRLLYAMGGRAYETTLDGRIYWASPDDAEYRVHHEVFPMPNGNVLSLARSFREVERDGELQPWMGTPIVEFDRHTNEVVWEWDDFDHFSTLDFDPMIMEEPGAGPNFPDVYDWTHSNSVVYNPDDDSVYVSVRHLSRITRIDYATGEIVYNMGFDMPSGDADFGDNLFSFQHAPELQPNGNMLLFDNGNRRDHRIAIPATAVSKAVEIAFNGSPPSSAEIVWEYTAPFYSPVQGDADRMPNGNTLVTVSVRGLLVEVDPNGTEVWRLELQRDAPGYAAYRSERIPELVVDAPADSDGDGLVDDVDNCPDHRNARQFDCDCDGMGDVCAVALGFQGECVPGCGPPLPGLALPEAASDGIAHAHGAY